MTIFECKICGHIEFNSGPEKCLVCRSQSTFVENADAIKAPDDPNQLTDAEKKHVPQIVVAKECGLIPNGECTDVHVKVGELEHVMQPDHYIRYIDYYLDGAFVSRMWLSPETCHPAAGLHLNATSGTVTAVENCNVHGNWMAQAEL